MSVLLKLLFYLIKYIHNYTDEVAILNDICYNKCTSSFDVLTDILKHID